MKKLTPSKQFLAEYHTKKFKKDYGALIEWAQAIGAVIVAVPVLWLLASLWLIVL